MKDETYKLILDKFKDLENTLNHMDKTYTTAICDLQDRLIMTEQILSKIIEKNKIITEKEAQEIADQALKAVHSFQSKNIHLS